MAAPTRLVLQGIIVSILADGEVTNAEVVDSINEAILSVRGDMLVTDGSAQPTIGATVALPAGFVYIYTIQIAEELVPDYAWYISESTTPALIFSPSFFAGAPSGTLTITGGSFQEILSVDGDTLNIDPGYITARALTNLHASRGGTASDLSDWHKSEHSKWAAIAEARLPLGLAIYGPPPDARLVRGRLTA